jgi:hypothetical protein
MKRTQILLAGLSLALGAFPLAGRAQGNPPAPAPPAPAATAAPASHAADTAIIVPADTTIPLRLLNTVSTRSAYVGQAIYCETIFPITVRNRIVIPVGSSVKGSVTQVVRPGRIKGKAQLGLRFETLILPSGATLRLRGTLSGFGGNGKEGFKRRESKIEGESSKGSDAGKIAQTTITGAEIGTIAGVGTHRVGTGLGAGSAAGALGGLIWVLASHGKELVLPSGTTFELELATPLTLERYDVDSPAPYDQGPKIPPRDPGPGL